MEERLSRNEIIEHLESAHDRLQATLARLTPEQMMKPGAVGYWSVKDVLAHLIFWNNYPVREIEAALKGQPFEQPQGSNDDINARAVAQYHDFDALPVKVAFEASYGLIWEMLKNLPDEAFEPGNRIEQALDETIHGALANNTYEHWPIHEAQIREWIEGNRTN